MSVDPATIECMFDTLSDPAALVAVIESAHRQESALVAQRLAAVAALLRDRVAAAERADHQRRYAEIDGFEQTTAEVAAAMNLSPHGGQLPGVRCRGAGHQIAQGCGSAGRRPHRLAHRAIDHQLAARI